MDNSKTSPRQIAILVSLIGVLALVIVVQYFVRPMFQEASLLKANTEQMETEYYSMYERSLMSMINMTVYTDLKKEIEEKGEKMYPLMKTGSLDKMVTAMVLKSGVTINALSINDITTHKVRILCEGVKSSDGFEITEEDVDMSKYPGAVLIPGEVAYLEYKTGYYSCVLNYTLQGTYSQIQALVNSVTENESMGIDNIYFMTEDNVSEDCVYEISIGIVIYMFDKLPDF